jgi:DNA-binding LacI/PurR family transcriptional regulator
VDDFATAAGVGPATFDRALNRRNGVGATTVEKVEQAADRLGGRWAAARRLAAPRERHLVRVNLFLLAPADGERFDGGQERIRIDIDLRDSAP